MHNFIEYKKLTYTPFHALKRETNLVDFVSMQPFCFLLKYELLSGKKLSTTPVKEIFAKNEYLFNIYDFFFFLYTLKDHFKATVYGHISLY